VSKLSGDLGLSESTIKKNIYLLARQYPHATKNALAQIYSFQNRKTIYRLLDKEDRASLPTTSPIVAPAAQQNIHKRKQVSGNSVKNAPKNLPDKSGFKEVYGRLHGWSEAHQGILQLIGVVVGILAIAIAIIIAL